VMRIWCETSSAPFCQSLACHQRGKVGSFKVH
jgi:hypothetical protein